MLYKIIIIAIICIFLTSTLKSYNQEISTFVSVAGGVIIFLLALDELQSIVLYLSELYSLTNLDFDFISIILKIICVGYITEFTADIADDFGNHIISSKVILGGKIVICGMSIPIIKKLLSVLLSFLY